MPRNFYLDVTEKLFISNQNIYDKILVYIQDKQLVLT